LNSCTHLEELYLDVNEFTATALDYLINLEKLKKLHLYDADVDKVNLDKLPNSLEQFYYSVKKGSSEEFLSKSVSYNWEDLHSDFANFGL